MRRFKTIAAILSLLLFWGCDSLLDTEPQQSISEDQALTTSSNVQAVLYGAYDNFGGSDLYGGHFYMLPDLLGTSGDAQWSGTYEGPTQVFQKNMLVDNENARATWLDAYQAINVANNVLSALDVVDAAEQDRVEGEAKFLRASIYFQLVRLYAPDYNEDPSAPGVPVLTEPTRGIDESSNVSRNTVQQVYDQVIADLTSAEGLLTGSNGVFATSYAAKAMLARVYLHMGEYADARDMAHDVITNGGFSLVGNYADAFNNSNTNTSEDIFATQVTSQDGVNNLHTFYASQQYGGRGDIEIQQQHLDRYEAGDDRLALFYTDPITGETRTGKWQNQYGNVNVIRLAEMYLIRAEANFRLGAPFTGQAPYEDLNELRSRANASTYTALDNITLQDILEERVLELAYEGHFLFDTKRTGGSVGSISWDADNLVFPIPQREMDANPNLTQNDGYGS
ncbi:MAG: RagB/SusD family nutrient uptake outer membrane protein [Bacteroidota bacterium]